MRDRKSSAKRLRALIYVDSSSIHTSCTCILFAPISVLNGFFERNLQYLLDYTKTVIYCQRVIVNTEFLKEFISCCVKYIVLFIYILRHIN
jgi:hypothetical protein